MMGQPMPQARVPQQQQQQLVNVSLPKVDMAEFAKCENTEARRSFVGNAVYPMIQEAIQDANLVGRVTGMIIDETVVQINRLLSDQSYFNQQVNEAYKLLLQQQRGPATPQSQ